MSHDESRATAPAPVSAFDHAIDARVGSLEDSRRAWRWVLALVAPPLFALMFWAVDRVQTSAEHVGETKATIESFKRTMDILDQDIRELRSKILKLSGVDPNPGLSIVSK